MSKLTMISASAGSGKTWSLTKAIFQAVVEGISPERIMAVTFTNKAAAELIERIREKLMKPEDDWVLEMNLSASQLEQLRAQAASLSDAYIGTVNSICARLLSEFAFEAGLSPSVDILPEEEGDRLFRLAVSHELKKYYPTLSGPAHRLSWDGGGKGFQKNPDWQEDVRRLVNLARSNGLSALTLKNMSQHSVDGLTRLLGHKWKSLDKHGLLNRVETALADILSISKDTTKVTKGAVSTLRRISRAINHGHETWADWVSLAALTAGKRSGADACLNNVREYSASVQGHPDLHADVQTLIEGVFACAAESLEGFDHYKRINGLMDFVDQESKVLELLDQDAVQNRLAERIDLIMVDEFQDTSPIQLALFTKLSALVKQSVWVGDQKQAIYGFRGTDPVLMDKVIEQLNEDQLSILENSWRSRKGLVEFSNEVFKSAFAPMDARRVCLEATRKDKQGLSNPLGVWRVHGDNKRQRMAALADGIVNLLENPKEWMIEDRRDQAIRPLKASDIAVLCRTNDACAAIAEALGEFGISASFGRGQLFTQPECAVVLAGLRLLVDEKDTLALAELVQYLPEHVSVDSWLTELASDQEKAFTNWRKDPRVSQFLAIRSSVFEYGPVELMQIVMDVLNVRPDLYRRANPKQALSNLDALEQLVGTYQNFCNARHQGASLPGLVYWLSRQDDPGLPDGKGEHTVQVCTYHKSKGLEWPLVILFDLDSKAKYSPFGAHVESTGEFDPEIPLANRRIRYWPEPISGKELDFTAAIENSSVYEDAKNTEMAERKRLMYVGITRARDYLILTQPIGKRAGDTSWLKELTQEQGDEITLPEPKDPSICIGEVSFQCAVGQYPSHSETTQIAALQDRWFIATEKTPQVDHVPYSIVPSSFENTDLKIVKVGERFTIGERTEMLGNVDMVHIGEAIHGFIAADQDNMEDRQRRQLATDLLTGWNIAGALTPEHLINFSDCLSMWIKQTWPNAIIHKEWPMRMRIHNQVAHGWIDMLLELPEGYIVIDHKSYYGDELENKATEYAQQLVAYKKAVELSSGKLVLQSLIYFPVHGTVLPLELQ